MGLLSDWLKSIPRAVDPVTVHLPRASFTAKDLKPGDTVLLRGTVTNVGDEVSINLKAAERVRIGKTRPATTKPVTTTETSTTLEYLKKVNPKPITPVPVLAT